MRGKVVVTGIRIVVELILENLAVGETSEQILEAHQRLTRQAIFPVLDFATQALRADIIYPICEHAALTCRQMKAWTSR